MSRQLGHQVIGQANNNLLQRCAEEESARINREVLLEREWWGSKVIQDEKEALEEGRLVTVPGEGISYRLIYTLRENLEPKTLNPIALQLLLEVQSRWQSAVELLGIDIAEIFLSVSSLYRNQDLQSKLAIKSHLASLGVSAHCAGAAIDFDPNGYYQGPHRRSIQTGSIEFSNIYTLTLKSVLESLVSENVCHVIWEKGFRIENGLVVGYNACYHVCVSPKFKTSF